MFLLILFEKRVEIQEPEKSDKKTFFSKGEEIKKSEDFLAF
jgi:hypothetical protein